MVLDPVFRQLFVLGRYVERTLRHIFGILTPFFVYLLFIIIYIPQELKLVPVLLCEYSGIMLRDTVGNIKSDFHLYDIGKLERTENTQQNNKSTIPVAAFKKLS